MLAWSRSLFFATALTCGLSAAYADGYLGIDAQDAEGSGVEILAVVEGSPAAKAGLKKGDVIVSFGGQKIRNIEGLAAQIGNGAPGKKSTVAVRRGNTQVELVVVLGERPESREQGEHRSGGEHEEIVEEIAEARESGEQESDVRILRPRTAGGGWMGVVLGEAENGVLVSDVVAESPAMKTGIQSGEVIRKVDGKAVSSAAQVVELVGTKKPGDKVQVETTAQREGARMEYTYVFKLGKRPAQMEAAAGGFRLRAPQGGDVNLFGNPTSIQWVEGFEEAFARAKKTGRPLMVKFTADWCGPCKALDREAFSDKKVIALSQRFVCTKVDIDKHGEIAEKYDVAGIPRVIMLSPGNETLSDFMGQRPTKDVLMAMETALKKAGPAKGLDRPAAGLRLAPSGGSEVQRLRAEVDSLRQEVRQLKEMVRKLLEDR